MFLNFIRLKNLKSFCKISMKFCFFVFNNDEGEKIMFLLETKATTEVGNFDRAVALVDKNRVKCRVRIREFFVPGRLLARCMLKRLRAKRERKALSYAFWNLVICTYDCFYQKRRTMIAIALILLTTSIWSRVLIGRKKWKTNFALINRWH